MLMAPFAWLCFSWQHSSVRLSKAFSMADEKQGALALSRRIRQEPAIPSLISLLPLPPGPEARSLALPASPVMQDPRAGGLSLPRSPMLLGALSHAPPCSCWHPIHPQTLWKPLAPLAMNRGAAPTPTPHRTGARDLLLWRIKRTMSWTMAGGAWPALRGRRTGDAAMAGWGLPSSRAIRRNRGVQWRVTKTASPGAQGT